MKGILVGREQYKKIMMMIIAITVIPVSSMGQTTPMRSGLRADFGIFCHDYKWAEYADNGPKLLEESGNIVGFTCDIASQKKMIGWRSGADIFFGEVDYDGQTWTGEPVQTDVLYVGAKLFCDFVPGYRFKFGLFLKPFAGLGGEFWLRDLADTKTADGDPVSGAEEWWGCIYGRMGIDVEYPLTKDMVIFSGNGIKVPFYARNEANFLVSGSPSAGLEPEQDFSVFASFGLRWKQWGAKISYDSLRFDRSDAVSSGTYDLYQPKSESDVYSVEVFWSKPF